MRGYAIYEAFYQDCEINAQLLYGDFIPLGWAKKAIYRKGTILS